jgi:hypothetical protein
MLVFGVERATAAPPERGIVRVAEILVSGFIDEDKQELGGSFSAASMARRYDFSRIWCFVINFHGLERFFMIQWSLNLEFDF